jgi:hypothetical protein
MTKIPSTTPRRSGKVRTVMLAVLLAGLGVPVYLLGARPLTPESSVARAIVRTPAGLTNEQGVRTTIQSQAAEGDASSEGIRIGFMPGQGQTASSAEVHVECLCAGDPADGIARADRLAQRFAESLRRQQEGKAADVYAKAKQSTAEASKKLDDTQSRLGHFVRDAFAREKKNSSTTKTTVNPEWQAVRRQLDHARQYRAGLLVDRTPLHPIVQAADDDIRDLEKRLAAIPRELTPEPGNMAEELGQMIEPPTEMPGLTGPAGKDVDQLDQQPGPYVPPAPAVAPAPPTVAHSGPMPAPTVAASPNRENSFRALQKEVADARKDYDSARARQDDAGTRRFHLPTIEVVPAQLVGGPVVGGSDSSHALTVALLVALAASAGIALVSEGLSGQAVYATAAHARATLGVPVLAVAPAADPVSRHGRRRRLVDSTIAVICGLFLLAVSAGVLLGVSRIATLF